MLVGVLALQGDVEEHRAALCELGAASRAVRRPQDLSGIDGLVLPGGESTTISMLLGSSGLEEPLGAALAEGLPCFGTCAGMILLSRAVSDGRPDQVSYGAIDLVVRRNGYGGQLDSFECDLEIGALGPEPFRAVFIRAPVVESAGPAVEVLASVGAAGPGPTNEHVSPVVCREANILVAAFHPELTGDLRLHELFLSEIGRTPEARARGGGEPEAVVAGAHPRNGERNP